MRSRGFWPGLRTLIVPVLVLALPWADVTRAQESRPATGPPSRLNLAVGLSAWTTPRQEYLGHALAAARSCGLTWVRIDFSWGVIEPTPGEWRWDQYDVFVEEARRAGLKILGILAYSAPWATGDPRSATDKVPPSNLGAFAHFAAVTAERYRGRVPAWEIWNEPDHPGFWQGTSGQYADLLARTHAALKSADPAALVVLGGLAQGGGADPRFLERLLADPTHPAGRHFDVMAFHANFKGIGTLRSTLAENRALLKRFGAPAIVWVTESAYTSSRWLQRLPSYGGGAAGQERYVQDLIAWAREEGLPFLSWAGIRDEPDASFRDPYGQAGLLTPDWTPKPAFRAFCAGASAVRAPRSDDPPDGATWPSP